MEIKKHVFWNRWSFCLISAIKVQLQMFNPENCKNIAFPQLTSSQCQNVQYVTTTIILHHPALGHPKQRQRRNSGYETEYDKSCAFYGGVSSGYLPSRQALVPKGREPISIHFTLDQTHWKGILKHLLHCVRPTLSQIISFPVGYFQYAAKRVSLCQRLPLGHSNAERAASNVVTCRFNLQISCWTSLR